MIRIGLTLVGLVATLLLTAIACGGDGESPASEGEDGTGNSVREIAVLMTDQVRFHPPEIAVTAGERVRLIIESDAGNGVHDVTVEDISVEDVMAEGSDATATGGHGMDTTSEYDLHVAVDGGESGTLEFTPMEAGVYEFFCAVTGHREAGMTGTLIVTA